MNTTQPKKRTSILKKILIGIACFFGFFLIIGIIGSIFFPIDYYNLGVDAYNKKELSNALYDFNRVKQNDKNYNDAIAKIRIIKPIIDSLENVKRLQKIDDDKRVDAKSLTTETDNATNTNLSSTNSSGSDLKTKVQNNIKSIDGGDDLTSSPMTSAQDFIVTVALFKAYILTINEGKKSADKEVIKLTKELEKKVVASQQKNFPKLRKAYYNFIKETLWENDITTTLFGNNNTILKFSGGYFAANRNIKSSQETLNEMITLLRFKETRYTWYNGQDEFTYYDINSKKDGDLEEYNYLQ